MTHRLGYLFLTFFILTLRQNSVFADGLPDCIQPVKLTPGGVDTILVSDLFYAKNYDLTFRENEHLSISFDGRTAKLAITARHNDFGATLLAFTLNGVTSHIPVIMSSGAHAQHTHTFVFRPDSAMHTVAVTGSFNNWNKVRDQLKDVSGKGVYELEVPLDPGSYMYKFVVDGKEVLDASNPEKTPTGFDDFNSVLRIADSDSTTIFLHIGKRTESGADNVFSFHYENSIQPQALASSAVIALLNNNKIAAENIQCTGNTLALHIRKSELEGEKTLRVIVTQGGRNTNLQQIQLVNGIPAGRNAKVSSWDDGIIYSILIDRFNNGDKSNDTPVVHDSLFIQANYQGGDVRGISNRIDDGYFDSLGVNILWISPVYDNPDIAFREYPPPHRWYSGYHGYWPISATQVEEKFGTMNELQQLIAKAHKHGMKVLLDCVAHHVHIDHPLFKQHPEWFGTLDLPDGRKNLRLWDEYRLSTWFEPYMPSFDYVKSTEAITAVSDNAVWWLQETGADGFRHDAVKHVPNEFWRALTKKIREKIEIPKHRKVYQIGETFGDYDLIASYVNNGQLSAQFNFNLAYFAIPVFVEPDKSFAFVDFHMKKSFASFGYNNLMGNIMDSHDKVRFMAYADGAITRQGVDTREMAWNNPPTVRNPRSYEKAKLYLAYMLTVPGLPVIYYGSEFGMTGADDPDNRRMMRFGDSLSVYEKLMLADTRKIVRMRNQHSALRYGDFLTLQADTAIYAYLRSDMNERLLVVLNKAESAQSLDLHLPEMYDAKFLVNIATGERIEVEANHVRATIGAVSWKAFVVE